jgi:hypothetical protein
MIALSRGTVLFYSTPVQVFVRSAKAGSSLLFYAKKKHTPNTDQ